MQSTQFPKFITGPLSIGDLLDRTFRLYRLRFRSMSAVAAIFLVPLGVISALVSGQALVNYMQLMGELATTSTTSEAELFDSMTTIFGTFGVLMLIGLLGFVATSLVTLASTSQSIAALHGETTRVRASIRLAFSRLLALLGMYLAFAGAAFVVTIAIVIVIVLFVFLLGLIAAGVGELFVDPSFGSGTDSLAFILGIGLIFLCLYGVVLALFFAPMLYLYARWFVAIPAMLAENLGPIGAMSRSWQLSKGSVWRNIFYVVLLFVISSVVLGLPLSLLQSVGSVFGMINASLGGLIYAASIGLGFIVSIVWQPFAAVAAVLLYYDLRVRHESYDLQLRVEQLESQIAGAPAEA